MFKDYLCKKILSKNLKLHNSYDSQTCYLFGNGYSLKYINLKKFNNVFSFTTGLNYIHRDFSCLNVVSDFHLHPGIFSPIWRHPYTKKLTIINKMREFLINTNRIPKKHNFFTSIYNYPFIKKKENIFFLHNFKKNFILDKINPSSEFSLMTGSLQAMIGVGVYMGFKKFIFVGMDYLSSKPKQGHFYEYGVRDNVVEIDSYVEQIKTLTNFFKKQNNCKFYFLSLNDLRSSIYENISYEEQFNTKENYQENYQIIDPKILKQLTNVEFEYFIYEKR